MLELKIAIYHRAASLCSQASCMYWLKNHWPDQALFKHYQHTNCMLRSRMYAWQLYYY